MSPFTKGLSVGLGSSLVAIVAATSLLVPAAYRRASSGWNLAPVVVANRDLPAGTELTYQDVAQRDLPEQFVTPAHLDPRDMGLVIGRVLPQELKAGEPLVFSSFAATAQDTPGCE